MCLGIPGKIVSVGDDITQMALVDVCGVKREVSIALICDDDPKDLLDKWVLVHVGFAMSLIDEQQAQETLEALSSMSALEHEVDDFSGLNNADTTAQ